MSQALPPIFVTRQLPQPVMARLAERFTVTCHSRGRPLKAWQLKRAVADQEGLVCTLADRVDREVIQAGPRLKIIANYAVGVNNIDLAAAAERGIWVTNTPGVLTDATADLTWALLLGVARRVYEGSRFLRMGRWTGWAPTLLLGSEVAGKTLGIVGMGRIGQAVARRGLGFSMRILYHQRHRLDPRVEKALQARYVSLDTLLAESDFVSLHVPLTPETHHLIGLEQLRRMKPTAFLINTSRGAVVDERALIWALRKGLIAGAGLDVFEEEPKVPKSLRQLKNALLLPHLGSATTETRIRMGFMVLENLVAVFEGRTPPNPVVAPGARK